MAHTFRRTVPVRIAGRVTRLSEPVLTMKMVQVQEEPMRERPDGSGKATAWFNEDDGAVLCRDCRDDAEAGGSKLEQIRAPKGMECRYCHQPIERTE